MNKLYVSADEVAKIIVNSAFNVHIALGPGLLESAYEACSVYELRLAGLEVKPKLNLPIVYRDIQLDFV